MTTRTTPAQMPSFGRTEQRAITPELSDDDLVKLSLKYINGSTEFNQLCALYGAERVQLLKQRAMKAKHSNNRAQNEQEYVASGKLFLKQEAAKADIANKLRVQPINDAIDKYGTDLTKFDLQHIAQNNGLRTDEPTFKLWAKACKEVKGFDFVNPASSKIANSKLGDM